MLMYLLYKGDFENGEKSNDLPPVFWFFIHFNFGGGFSKRWDTKGIPLVKKYYTY